MDRMTEELNEADPNELLRCTLTQPGEQWLAGMMLHGARTLLMLNDARTGRIAR